MNTFKSLTTSVFFIFLIVSNNIYASQETKAISFESPQTKARLIELYTSEGCYSCPPADDWIRKLKTDKRLWKEFVPVSFHVDYWDYIGWKDKYASPEFTRRQHRYANVWSMRTVYTPGFFLNGREWRGFFNKRFIPDASSAAGGKLQARLKEDTLEITFQPVSGDTYYDINIAVLGFDLTSEIHAGENEGKTLRHDFVALGFKTVAMQKTRDGNFKLTTSLPHFKNYDTQLGLAAWITEQGSPLPVQSTGGWINNPAD